MPSVYVRTCLSSPKKICADKSKLNGANGSTVKVSVKAIYFALKNAINCRLQGLKIFNPKNTLQATQEAHSHAHRSKNRRKRRSKPN